MIFKVIIGTTLIVIAYFLFKIHGDLQQGTPSYQQKQAEKIIIEANKNSYPQGPTVLDVINRR